MTTKRQRPSPDQWARLDAALDGLCDRTPPGTAPALSQEIIRRADTLRAALESGWRIRDLAAFFKDSAGIDVSPSTIQTALRQALNDTTSDSRRPRAKRPRKRSASGNRPEAKAGQATHKPGAGTTPPLNKPAPVTEASADAPRPRATMPLGSTLTQGASKRGQK